MKGFFLLFHLRYGSLLSGKKWLGGIWKCWRVLGETGLIEKIRGRKTIAAGPGGLLGQAE